MANSIFTDLIGRDMLSPVLSAGENAVNKFGTQTTAMFTKIGAAITGALSIKTVIDFGKASIEAAMESEEAWAKWEATQRAAGDAIRITNEQLGVLATELQNVTRFEDEAVVNAASLLSIYENLNSEAFERTIKLAADMASLFGTDLEGATRQLGRALDDPIQGLTQLRRTGVVLSESTKQLIKDLVEQGKTVEAQNVLFEQLEKRFDGLSEAMGETTTGRIAKVNNQFGELKETIGRGLLPVLESLLSDLESLSIKDNYNLFGQGTGPFTPFKGAAANAPPGLSAEETDARNWQEFYDNMLAEEKARTELQRKQQESIDKSRMEREGIEERAQEADRRKDAESAEQRRIEGMISVFAGAGRIRPKQQADEDTFEAAFEGLTDLNRRISQAAASEDKEEKVKEAIVEQSTMMVEKFDAQRKIDEEILEIERKRLDPLAPQAETGLA